MAIVKLEGLVLSCIKFQESSKILKLYTKEQGLISVIAKGAYSLKKSNAGMETLCFSSFTIYTKETRKMQNLTAADIINYNLQLRENLFTLSAAQAIAELLSKVIHEQEPSVRLYKLLEAFFVRLDSEKSKSKDFALRMLWCFFARFISLSGFSPILKRCADCGSNLDLNKHIFSISKSGFICSNCHTGFDAKHTAILTPVMADAFRIAFTSKVEDFDSLNLEDRDSFLITDLLEKIIKYNFELNLEIFSLKFFRNGAKY